MGKQRILVIDDEAGMLEVYEDALARLEEAAVETMPDSRQGLELAKSGKYDLLIVDLKMPGISGMEIIRAAREADPGCAAMLVTAYPTVDTAVESMKLGAVDYLSKPIDPLALVSIVHRILEQRQLKAENRLLTRFLDKSFVFDDMIGRGPHMAEMFALINQVAATDVPVLIRGENGVGKTLAARSIHKRSRRGPCRFVGVDCNAIPANLAERDFFGTETSGAPGASPLSGLVGFAQGGTLFLQEITGLSLTMQARILELLQQKTFCPVGGEEPVAAEIRLIAAASQDIEQEVQAGRFDRRLFEMIKPFSLDLPPLREREEDLPSLTEYYLKKFAAEIGREVPDIEADVLEVLSAYAWPGNIGELQNFLKRAIITASGPSIKLTDVPERMILACAESKGKSPGFFEKRAEKIQAFEATYFTMILERTDGNVSEAAREAGLPRGTFYRLINKYGLDPASFR